MRRPIYETEADRHREAQIAERAARAWKCEARPLPRKYVLDYGFFRGGRLRAFVEVKFRNCASNGTPFVILSATKWKSGLEYAERFGAAFVLLFAFTDGTILYWTVEDTKPELAFNGRKDRGDSQDMEPVVYLPIHQFKQLKEKQ